MKIVILGFGNVAQHLVRACLTSEEVRVIQIYNRSKINFPAPVAVTDQLSELAEADVYIIAIPDDTIPNFSEKLPFENRLVVHTSGSVALNRLSEKNRRGIFYPLQSFSNEREVDFKPIPICIEAENISDINMLKILGHSISEKVVEISSAERQKLHLAAVFANNFTNHLYRISEEIIASNHLDFDLLKPLIMETARKIETLSPNEAQTGPAKRNDSKTIGTHLELLDNDNYKDIYKTLTKSIIETHGKKL